MIENQSPYYLHPLRGPEVAITSVIFNGKNYDLWRKVMRMVLKSKKKLGFVKGTLAKSKPKEGENQSELVAWKMVNFIICSWIMNMIDPKLHASMALC